MFPSKKFVSIAVISFFILWVLSQEVGCSDLQSFCCSLYLTVPSVLFSLCVSALGCWQTVTLYPPILCTGIHA